MKFLTISIIISLMAIYGVQASFLPKFPKLIMKYDASEESEESLGLPLFKFPKFGPKLAKKKELEKNKQQGLLDALAEKETMLAKLAEKKEDKFEDRLLDFFEDRKNAKTVFDKLEGYKFHKPAEKDHSEEKECKCKERKYDNCGGDIRYFD